MAAYPQSDDTSDVDIETEIDELITEHGDERAVIRALLHDMTVLMIDANRSSSRGFLRGVFSEGARPIREPQE